MRMMPNFEYTHSTEKARDTTLNDENASQRVTSVLVTALCNQPVLSLRTSVTTSHVTCKICSNSRTLFLRPNKYELCTRCKNLFFLRIEWTCISRWTVDCLQRNVFKQLYRHRALEVVSLQQCAGHWVIR